jgi:hypothetical protein
VALGRFGIGVAQHLVAADGSQLVGAARWDTLRPESLERLGPVAFGLPPLNLGVRNTTGEKRVLGQFEAPSSRLVTGKHPPIHAAENLCRDRERSSKLAPGEHPPFDQLKR